jgi:hypothetical protein
MTKHQSNAAKSLAHSESNLPTNSCALMKPYLHNASP